VPDCAASAASAHQVDLLDVAVALLEQAVVDFKPWVLVTAENDRWTIGVQEENVGIRRRLRQEVLFNGEIHKGIQCPGEVYLGIATLVLNDFGKRYVCAFL